MAGLWNWPLSQFEDLFVPLPLQQVVKRWHCEKKSSLGFFGQRIFLLLANDLPISSVLALRTRDFDLIFYVAFLFKTLVIKALHNFMAF